jgi:hypothetical protein
MSVTTGCNKTPGVVIGGAPKSGTTALYYYLKQHPGFCLPQKKELHYFSRAPLERTTGGPGDRFILAEIPKTFEDYLQHFRHCEENQLAVDISPSYLYHQEAAEKIRGLLPDAQIIFILRNPVEKAFSQYLHLIGAGREHLPFRTAIDREQERRTQGYSDMWLYRQSGYYADAIEHYLHVFGEDSVKTFYHEEFLASPSQVLREICEFVGAKADFAFQEVADVNRSGSPRSALLAKLFLAPNAFTYLLRRAVPGNFGRRVRKMLKDRNTGVKPLLPEDLRATLLDGFKNDILRVEELVGRPSGWI